MENGITNHDFESAVVLLSVCHIYQDLKLHMDLPEFTKKIQILFIDH